MDDLYGKKNEFVITRKQVFRFCNRVRDKEWPKYKEQAVTAVSCYCCTV
jgi:hypothetical protein